jgi:alpha-beta hydrolase superfamily lysophospholipase
MRRSRGTVSCKSNRRIFYQYWLPDRIPKAVILLVHGLGEHSCRYGHVAQYFVEAGLGVCALDLPGHGQSYGTPGHVSQFNDYLDAVGAVQAQVIRDYDNVPMVLLGHSMGGLVAANYLLEHQQDFCACVLSAPLFRIDDPPGKVMQGALKTLSKTMPRMGVQKLDPSGVSRDPLVVHRYKNDPLVHHGRLSARLVFEMFGAMKRAMDFVGTVRLPVLLLHGGQDKMTSIDGSRQYYKNLAAQDKRLRTYPNLYHEVFNEPEHKHILRHTLNWILPRIPQ